MTKAELYYWFKIYRRDCGCTPAEALWWARLNPFED